LRGCGAIDDWRCGVSEAFEFLVDEVAEVPAVEVFEGEFAGCVVAAGEDFGDVVYVEGVEVFVDVEGVVEGEGQVVSGMDNERASRFSRMFCGEAFHVRHGADDGEYLADLILSQAGLFE